MSERNNMNPSMFSSTSGIAEANQFSVTPTIFEFNERILPCGFIANFILGGLAKAYGLIVQEYQEIFQSGTAPFLLAGGLIYTLMYCLAPLVYFVSDKYGPRLVLMIGALGSFASLMGVAFAPNVPIWVALIGGGLGTSFACVYFTIFVVVGKAFRKRMGLAQGVTVAGVSIGQMAFPAIITALNIRYGARGAAVIMSAICLNLLLTAALMPRHIKEPLPKQHHSGPRRRSWFRRQRKQQVNGELVEVVGANGDASKQPLVDVVESHVSGTIVVPQPESDQQAISETPPPVQPDDFSNNKLTNTLLVVYVLAKCFGDLGDITVSFMAPNHGFLLQLSEHNVSFAITISGAVDLVARIIFGLVIDRPLFKGRRGLLLVITWFVESLNTLAFSCLGQVFGGSTDPTIGGSNQSKGSLLAAFYACFGIHGVCSGISVTMMVIVLSDFVGTAKLGRSLAITFLVLGVAMAPGQFLIGLCKDYTGSFVLSLQICFSFLLIAGFLLLLEFPVRWQFRRRDRRLRKLSSRNDQNGLEFQPTGGESRPAADQGAVAC